MAGRKISTDDWIGKRFANGWEIIRKISRQEEIELGMGTHNAHFECYNHNCGVTTCIEKTTLNTYLTSPRDVLYNCRNCNPEACKYKDKVRKQVGRDAVVAKRNPKVSVGDVFGNFEVVKIKNSTEFGEHQSRAVVRCQHCGAERECLFHHLFDNNVACECFKTHSIGEGLIKNYLDERNIEYQTEYTFDELRGLKGGMLRYDVAIFKNNILVGLIEFDGEQHYFDCSEFFGHSLKENQEHDSRKTQWAEEHNIPLLRIPFWEKGSVPVILEEWLKEIL